MSHQELVERWFSQEFTALAKPLQNLHRNGGMLQGDVTVCVGRGAAKLVAQRLAKRLNIPPAGRHHLKVTISHHGDGLHWDRQFDGSHAMCSTFEPIGTIDSGYWLERTGPVTLTLTVDIIDGGWHWRCLKMSLFGVPVPNFLMPKSTAYKTIENDRYRFFVGFTWLGFGTLLSYSGLLSLNTNPRTH